MKRNFYHSTDLKKKENFAIMQKENYDSFGCMHSTISMQISF